MSFAAILVQIGLALCGVGLVIFVSTIGYGTIFAIPLVGLAALLFLLAAATFWFGVIQSAMATGDAGERRILWSIALLIPGLFGVNGASRLTGNDAKTSGEYVLIAAALVYALGVVVWLIFARRTARRLEIHELENRFTRILLIVCAVIACALFAVLANVWLIANIARFGLNDKIQDAVVLLTWLSRSLTAIGLWFATSRGRQAIIEFREQIAVLMRNSSTFC